MGFPTFDSPNGAMMEDRGGASLNDLIVRNGQRSNIFRSYVSPKLDQRNLTVLTGALVSHLTFDGTTVTGVEVIEAGQRRRYMADREVILSLGSINTPKVLMQSGIGPEPELRRHGIPIVQALAGVGRNHQDHVSFGCIFESKEPQDVGYGGSEATFYWKSEPGLALPDIFHCQLEFPVPTPETAARGVPSQGWMVFAGLSHPKSRGSVHLSGPGVNDPVLIDANTLSHPDDLETALVSVDLCRQMAASAPFRSLLKREAMPGSLDRHAMENYLRDSAVTYWHQACTAKMGRDAMSVVDGNLKVYGIERLRIADASIMPNITSGNTMAPCVVIGERAAEIIEARHRTARRREVAA